MVREVDGEVLLLDIESDQVHRLNMSASFIWRKFAVGTDPLAIAEMLATEFDVDQATAYKDVTETLDRFRALKFIA